MTDHDAEMDAILEQLEGAGLVEVYVNADGKQAMRLTDGGERVARQMAMSEDPDAVLDALLEVQSQTLGGGPPHAGRASNEPGADPLRVSRGRPPPSS